MTSWTASTSARARTGYDPFTSVAFAPEDLSAELSAAGLAGSEAMARFLWDSGVAAVVCDNPAVEVVPGDPSAGSLHARLIPCLGFAIGELFDFGPLASACERSGRYEFMFASVPLNLTGGVGRPATRSRPCSARRGSRAGFCGRGPIGYLRRFPVPWARETIRASVRRRGGQDARRSQ